MPETARVREVVRFGVFELDAASRELRKNGLKIRLPEQPFRVLALLLESPGEIVTREEIRWQLWSGETFVDYNHGINAAVKKLRRALGDSAETPRYVETVPRRGYRLIVPVEKSVQSRVTSAGQLRHWLIFAAMLASALLLAMTLLALRHKNRSEPRVSAPSHARLTFRHASFEPLPHLHRAEISGQEKPQLMGILESEWRGSDSQKSIYTDLSNCHYQQISD